MLLEGDLFASVSLLRGALQQPFGASTHLSAHKNLYWVAHLLRDAAESNESVDRAGSEVLQAFATVQAHIEEAPPNVALDEDAITVHDLPVQRAICLHPLYDRHYRRESTWEGMDASTRWRRRYLDLLKRSLTRYLTRDLSEDVRTYKGSDAPAVQQACGEAGDDSDCEAPWHIGQGAYQVEGPYSQKWLSGLVHLEVLLEDVLSRKIAGDWIEAGCYTGGTAVLLRAILQLEDDDETYGTNEQPKPVPLRRYSDRGGEDRTAGPLPRRILLADSFDGIPMPRTERGRSVDTSAEWPERYRAGQTQARSTLRRYGLLDDRIVFVPGYFNETLRSAPAERYSLIHIDADAYDSVLDALDALYPKLSVGGHVVIDDFHLPGVRAAVRDYRRRHDVTEPILPVPSDHVTACATDWSIGGALTVHPLTVAYWTRKA